MGEDIQVGEGVKAEEADYSYIIEHFVREFITHFLTSIVELRVCR